MNASRFASCGVCGTETAQKHVGRDRSMKYERSAEFYKCSKCGTRLVSYADVYDGEGFIRQLVDKWLRSQFKGEIGAGDVRSVEREEAIGQGTLELWAAFVEWDPTREVRFRAFASFRVNARLTSWIRAQRGGRRDSAGGRRGSGAPGSPKAHAVADSLDAPVGRGDGDAAGATRLERTLGSLDRDPSRDRSPDLAGALRRRGSGVDRAQSDLGLRRSA